MKQSANKIIIGSKKIVKKDIMEYIDFDKFSKNIENFDLFEKNIGFQPCAFHDSVMLKLIYKNNNLFITIYSKFKKPYTTTIEFVGVDFKEFYIEEKKAIIDDISFACLENNKVVCCINSVWGRPILVFMCEKIIVKETQFNLI